MYSPDQTHSDVATQIGQMFIVGFRGLAVHSDDPILRDIRDRQIGGVLLFDYDVPTQTPARNIQSPDQVRRLVASLQDAAAIPLFVAIDQEGGRVNRLKETAGFPPTVTADYLGRANQLPLTRQWADRTAATLADVGINLNFAPVVDLNTNPANPIIGKFERSFSPDPAVVTAHALEWIRAHHARQVCCALKHFPGHGSSRSDSHLGFVDITETWTAAELIPYAEIIAADACDMVMTAHVFQAHLDPVWPATLSQAIITGLLRQQLGYDGLVIADDLQMQAIAAYYSLETALQTAIDAGVDLFIVGNNMAYDAAMAATAIQTVRQLVADGRISAERIAQSARRIGRLKDRL